MDFMSHVGPMARTVADLGLILPIIWGPDSTDTWIASVPFPNPDRLASKSLRCAVMVNSGISEVEEETVAVVERTATLLEDAGFDVQWKSLEGVTELPDLVRSSFRLGGYAFLTQATRAAGTDPQDVANNWLKELDPTEVSPEEFSEWRNHYFQISAQELNAHMARIEDFRSRLLQQITEVDVLISPVNSGPAPMLPPAGNDPFPDGSYTELFNVTGWPAGVVRAGTSSDGLPIGVQIAANPWREDIVLAVMALVEAGLPTFPPPDLVIDSA